MKKWIVRHGDVLLEMIDKLPDNMTKLENRNWLALGETTSHAHRIDIGDLFETKDGQLYLKVDRLAHLSHEEHKTVVINPGVYKVTIKRQYIADGGWESVRD